MRAQGAGGRVQSDQHIAKESADSQDDRGTGRAPRRMCAPEFRLVGARMRAPKCNAAWEWLDWTEVLDWADRGDTGGLPLEFGLSRIRPLLGRADYWTGFAATGPCWADEPLGWAAEIWSGPLDLEWSAGSGVVRWVRIGLLPALPRRGVDPLPGSGSCGRRHRVAGVGELWASSSSCRDRGAVGVVNELQGSGSCGRRHRVAEIGELWASSFFSSGFFRALFF
ncbi:hypothetical protein CRG98_001524 [Punica granatum]|uniref:Uncharacterized protein n=1 Tax=Punica granatum TaxID=22663 RepID=A0A2I0LBK6_PUNGR|nr:hypothetical protein CRG98_001524 [Punica granatum]